MKAIFLNIPAFNTQSARIVKYFGICVRGRTDKTYKTRF